MNINGDFTKRLFGVLGIFFVISGPLVHISSLPTISWNQAVFILVLIIVFCFFISKPTIFWKRVAFVLILIISFCYFIVKPNESHLDGIIVNECNNALIQIFSKLQRNPVSTNLQKPEKLLHKANTYLTIKKYDQAADVYRNSILATNVIAQNNLGVLLATGKNIEQDSTSAEKCFENAVLLSASDPNKNSIAWDNKLLYTLHNPIGYKTILSTLKEAYNSNSKYAKLFLTRIISTDRIPREHADEAIENYSNDVFAFLNLPQDEQIKILESRTQTSSDVVIFQNDGEYSVPQNEFISSRQVWVPKQVFLGYRDSYEMDGTIKKKSVWGTQQVSATQIDTKEFTDLYEMSYRLLLD